MTAAHADFIKTSFSNDLYLFTSEFDALFKHGSTSRNTYMVDPVTLQWNCYNFL